MPEQRSAKCRWYGPRGVGILGEAGRAFVSSASLYPGIAIFMVDPRIFFAAERTLLAWIRTGLTVIALGFVIGRFGLLISIFTRQAGPDVLPESPSVLANVIGILLVVAGTITLFLASEQHRAYLRQLSPTDVPSQYRPQIALFLGFALAMTGVLIVFYLVWTAVA